jgi:hypothetical protein
MDEWFFSWYRLFFLVAMLILFIGVPLILRAI